MIYSREKRNCEGCFCALEFVSEKCSKLDVHKLVEYSGKILVVNFCTKTPSMNCTHLHVIIL